MAGGDGKADTSDKWGIPAAFYRDEPLPPPPPGDPHRVEFNVEPQADDLPEWMLLGLPLAALVVAALHIVVALVIVLLVR